MAPAEATSDGTLGLAARERARVRKHLTGAEQFARRRAVQLDPLAARCRAILLQELARYRRRGHFPRHPGHTQEAVPQFIDARGTPCAVAHLMQITGQGELVRHIANTENDALVHTLARHREVRAWLDAAGLSLDEAARIQPSYCYYVEAAACFCSNEQESPAPEVPGVAVGTVTALEGLVLRIRVDRIGGAMPGLAVGDERELALDGREPSAVGSQLLLGYRFDSDASAGPDLVRVHPQLTIDGDSVTCDYNSATAERPVSVDTAVEALLASGGHCINVLARDDSEWNIETCDHSGLDSAVDSSGQESSGDGSGCSLGLGDGGAHATGALTSAAVLAALLLYRRNRG